MPMLPNFPAGIHNFLAAELLEQGIVLGLGSGNTKKKKRGAGSSWSMNNHHQQLYQTILGKHTIFFKGVAMFKPTTLDIVN